MNGTGIAITAPIAADFAMLFPSALSFVIFSPRDQAAIGIAETNVPLLRKVRGHVIVLI
jgi:hypothetical protein